MKSDTFVMDTNALVRAFLIRHSVSRLAYDKAVQSGVLADGLETYHEFREVFLRNKFTKYATADVRSSIVDNIKGILTFYDISEIITDCRDPKDNKFLELAVCAKASCLITGDNDLLIFNPYRNIPIINASYFVTQFAV